VAATLAPAVVIDTTVVVNGISGDVIRQPGSRWTSSPVDEVGERA
jgi:hypothetical protein